MHRVKHPKLKKKMSWWSHTAHNTRPRAHTLPPHPTLLHCPVNGGIFLGTYIWIWSHADKLSSDKPPGSILRLTAPLSQDTADSRSSASKTSAEMRLGGASTYCLAGTKHWGEIFWALTKLTSALNLLAIHHWRDERMEWGGNPQVLRTVCVCICYSRDGGKHLHPTA